MGLKVEWNSLIREGGKGPATGWGVNGDVGSRVEGGSARRGARVPEASCARHGTGKGGLMLP